MRVIRRVNTWTGDRDRATDGCSIWLVCRNFFFDPTKDGDLAYLIWFQLYDSILKDTHSQLTLDCEKNFVNGWTVDDNLGVLFLFWTPSGAPRERTTVVEPLEALDLDIF